MENNLSEPGQITILTCLLAALLFHELPNGRVEVGLDAVAFPDRLEIAYQVDINDDSMRDQLAADLAVSEPDQLLDNYRRQALKNIGEKLIVWVDGKEQAVKPLRSELGPRHPVRFICYYQVDLSGLEQQSELKEFEIHDKSYEDFEKEFRYALRGKDGVEVVESNVAQLLVRAERCQLWKFPAGNRDVLQTIRAKVTWPATIRNDGSKLEANGPSFFRLWHAFALLAAIVLLILVVGRFRR